MKTNDTLPPTAEIDRMLSAFFKSEMPAAFPPLKLPLAPRAASYRCRPR